jgi:hypothetical protein
VFRQAGRQAQIVRIAALLLVQPPRWGLGEQPAAGKPPHRRRVAGTGRGDATALTTLNIAVPRAIVIARPASVSEKTTGWPQKTLTA